MAYRFEIWNSIDEVNLNDWNSLQRKPVDLFMQTRFIKAIEQSMNDQCQFRYLIVYNEQEETVASSCLSSVYSYYQLDPTLFEPGFRKRTIETINKVAPWFLYGPIVLCGLPVSGIETQLRIADGARRADVLQLIDENLKALAKETKANSISFKDFDDHGVEKLEALSELGYRKADIAPMNHAHALHADFTEYMTSMRGKDRAQVRRSQRKFEKAGLRVEFLSGAEGADKLYSEEVHQLYESVFERATQRLEKLPFNFLPELVRQLGEEAFFMYIYQEDKIVAFCVSAVEGATYHGLYAGVDQELNHSCDLYFNMFYHLVDHGLKQGAKRLALGQSADKFKQYKLNCFQVPLYCYVKGANPVSRVVTKLLFDWMLPARYQEAAEAVPATPQMHH